MLSTPEYEKMVIGARLVRKAALTVLEMDEGVFLNFRIGGRMIGVRRIIRVSDVKVLRSRAVSITFTWSCTKMSGS